MEIPESTDVESNIHKWTVTTYELSIPHGPNRNQHYETIIDNGPATGVEDRYTTEDEAIVGHEEIVTKLREGRYELIPVSYRLNLRD